jgi:hypothetical protein
MTPPTRATTAGRAYLDLRHKARQDRRPVDELMQLYVLESFLARMSLTQAADRFVLKGGLLLAAVRVSMTASLATARPSLHIDVSVGDPITPAPRIVHLPRILGGTIAVPGYPLAMVHAEKIVTAVARGTASTRWRDFADIYALARRHPIDGTELGTSIREVARHRGTRLAPLSNLLDGYGAIGQQRWDAWRRKQRLDDRMPGQFSEVVAAVVAFADPAISG